MNLATGIVATVAGNGEKGVPKDGADAKAQPLVDPRAVAVDARGQIYICERGGHALRSSTARDTSARSRAPASRLQRRRRACAEGGDERPEAHQHRHRRHRADHGHRESRDPALRPDSGTIERVAGTGQPGAAGLDGPPDQLQLNRPHGAFRYKGALYISDSENHRVVAVD